MDGTIIVIGYLALVCILFMYSGYKLEKKYNKLYHEYEALKVHAKAVKKTADLRGDIIDELKAKLEASKGLPDSINEALNMGDGSYRP